MFSFTLYKLSREICHSWLPSLFGNWDAACNRWINFFIQMVQSGFEDSENAFRTVVNFI